MFVSLIRTVILYAIVIFAVRVMGKRQIKEMQASEIVVTLMISNIAAMPMQEVGISIFTGIIPILTLVVTEITMSYIMLKYRPFRQLISGMPVVVIEKGKINQAAMRSLRLSNEDLFEELRKKDIFDPGTVEYVYGMLMWGVREGFACENAARRMAMDNAGRNAREMLDDLRLTYNRARQGAITQEITEIVAGSGR